MTVWPGFPVPRLPHLRAPQGVLALALAALLAAATSAYAAPTATTDPATALGSGKATLNATVNPAGAPTDAWFEYGPTTAYGTTTATTAVGSGITDVSVPRAVTGLTYNSVVNFRVVAANGAGPVYGLNRSFTVPDTTAPTVPTVTGGSAGWQSVASIPITASGSTDGESGLARYEFQTSTDDGITWSGTTAGATATVTAQEFTSVRFRAVDNAGNASAWTFPGPSATAMIDREAPQIQPDGGLWTWFQAPASVTVTANVDDFPSGVVATEYRTSSDNGVTWSTPAAGTSVTITDVGDTDVQFRATDAAGNVSAWSSGLTDSHARITPQPGVDVAQTNAHITIRGRDNYTFMGNGGVADAGDVNNDGIPDLIVGAPTIRWRGSAWARRTSCSAAPPPRLSTRRRWAATGSASAARSRAAASAAQSPASGTSTATGSTTSWWLRR